MPPHLYTRRCPLMTTTYMFKNCNHNCQYRSLDASNRWGGLKSACIHAAHSRSVTHSLPHNAHASASNLPGMLSLRLHAVMMSTEPNPHTHTCVHGTREPCPGHRTWFIIGCVADAIPFACARELHESVKWHDLLLLPLAATGHCWSPSPLWTINCRQHIEWNWPHRVPARCARTRRDPTCRR